MRRAYENGVLAYQFRRKDNVSDAANVVDFPVNSFAKNSHQNSARDVG